MVILGDEETYELTDKGRRVLAEQKRSRHMSYPLEVLNGLNDLPDKPSHLQERLGERGMYRGPEGLIALQEQLNVLVVSGDVKVRPVKLEYQGKK